TSTCSSGKPPTTNQVRPSRKAMPRPSLANRSIRSCCFLPTGTCAARSPPLGWKRSPPLRLAMIRPCAARIAKRQHPGWFLLVHRSVLGDFVHAGGQVAVATIADDRHDDRVLDLAGQPQRRRHRAPGGDAAEDALLAGQAAHG